MAAAHLGHSEVVDALLAGGADPTATDREGLTALHIAQRAGRHACARMLGGGGGGGGGRWSLEDRAAAAQQREMEKAAVRVQAASRGLYARRRSVGLDAEWEPRCRRLPLSSFFHKVCAFLRSIIHSIISIKLIIL